MSLNTITTLSPGVAWTGVEDIGGALPTASAVPAGLGLWGRPTHQILAEPLKYVTPGTTLTLQALTGLQGGISKVTFYLEGNQVDVTRPDFNPDDGMFGHLIQPSANGATSGRARLGWKVVTVNGLEAVGSVILFLAAAGHSRPIIYVRSPSDPVTPGNDTTGNGTSGAPYASLGKAIAIMTAATATWDGGIIDVGAGTFAWAHNTGFANTRLVTVRGAGRTQTILTRDPINRTVRTNFTFLRDENLKWDLDGFTQVYGKALAGANWHHHNVLLQDALGPDIPIDKGQPVGFDNQDIQTQPSNLSFRDHEGQTHSFSDCTIRMLHFGGSTQRVWNCVGQVSGDSWYVNRSTAWAWQNNRFTQKLHGYNRLHTTLDLEVDTVGSYAGGSTTITVKAGPTLRSRPDASTFMWVLQSANGVVMGNVDQPQNTDGTYDRPGLNGNGQGALGWRVSSIDPVTRTYVIAGDVSNLSSGDLVRVWNQVHGDMGQFGLAPNLATDGPRRNYSTLNCIFESSDQQLVLDNTSWVPASGTGTGQKPANPGGFANIPVQSGATVSSNGTVVTIDSGTMPAAMRADCWIVGIGAQPGIARRIKSIDSATQATLFSAFPSNLPAGTSFALIVGLCDIVYASTIRTKGTVNASIGQHHPGIINVWHTHSTLLGADALGGTIKTISQYLASSTEGYDLFGFVNSIVKQLESGIVGQSPPTAWNRNNHYISGTQRDADGLGGTGNCFGSGAFTVQAAHALGYLPDPDLTKTATDILSGIDVNESVIAIPKIGAVSR